MKKRSHVLYRDLFPFMLLAEEGTDVRKLEVGLCSLISVPTFCLLGEGGLRTLLVLESFYFWGTWVA